jgi:uncharacterized membrane protein YcfT
MQSIQAGGALKGKVKMDYFNDVTMKSSEFYIRIFDKSFDEYIREKQLTSFYITNFWNYQKEHSIIIKAIQETP